MIGQSDNSASQVLSGGSTTTSMKSVMERMALVVNNKDKRGGKRAKARATDRRLRELSATALHSLVPRSVDTGLFLKGGLRLKPSKLEEYVVSVHYAKRCVLHGCTDCWSVVRFILPCNIQQ